MTVRLTYLILLFYIIFLWIFLNIWGIDALKGTIDFEFYADSETYMELAEGPTKFIEMVFLNPNLIGPVYLSRLLGNNYNLIFIFNAFTLFYSYKLITTHFNVNRYLLLFLWILSPVMLSSVLSVNKEIVAVLSTVFAVIYIKEKNFWYLLGAILLGLFVRWQQVLFVLLLFGMYSGINPFRKKMFLSFILILVAISILYPIATFRTVEDMMSTSEQLTDSETGSGIYYIFNKFQAIPFGYTLVFIPKLFFILFSMISKIGLFAGKEDFYNYTIIVSQCICYLGITVLLFIKKKVSFNNLFFFSCMMYCLLFALSPIFSPRYLFIFYILSAVAVSEESNVQEQKHNL